MTSVSGPQICLPCVQVVADDALVCEKCGSISEGLVRRRTTRMCGIPPRLSIPRGELPEDPELRHIFLDLRDSSNEALRSLLALFSLPHYGTRNQLIDRAYTAGLTIGMRRSRNILPLDHEELPLGLDVTEAIPKDSASPASSAAGAVPKASPRSSPRAADETDANDGYDDEIVDGVWGAGKAEKINILICRECLVSNPTGGAFPYCGRCGKNSAYVPLWHPTSTRLPGPPQQDSDLFPIYKQLALATIMDLRRLLAIFNLPRSGP